MSTAMGNAGPMFRARTVVPLVLMALLLLTACDSGSSKTGAKPRTSSTTRRKHRRPTSTTAATGLTSSTSTTTAPATPTSLGSTPTTVAPPTSGACGPRAGAIYAAVQGGDLGPVPLTKYTIADCRIANSNQIWSAITLVPVPGTGVTQLTVALERVGSIWQVRAYGQDHVSCDAPPPVPTELRLGC